jgi:hypothetical protein
MRHSVFALVGAGALVAVLAACETRDDTVDTGVTTDPVTTPAAPPPATTPPPPPAMPIDTPHDTIPGQPGAPGTTP